MGAPYLLDPLPKRSAPPTRGTLNSSMILMEVKTIPLSLLLCLYMALYLYRICIVLVFFIFFFASSLSPVPSSKEKFFSEQGNFQLVHHPLLWPALFLKVSHSEHSPLWGKYVFPSSCLVRIYLINGITACTYDSLNSGIHFHMKKMVKERFIHENMKCQFCKLF